MGSKKYPQENKLDDFLSKHGGFTNAWTDCERVNLNETDISDQVVRLLAG